jgi:hypothetical protein
MRSYILPKKQLHLVQTNQLRYQFDKKHVLIKMQIQAKFNNLQLWTFG